MPTILGANTLSTGYDVANSLRLNSGDSPYMHKVKDNNNEINTITFSAWVKRSKLGATQRIVSHMTNGFADYFYFRFNDSDVFEFAFKGSANNIVWTTNRIFRDVSAWYHIVARVDTTNGTAGNRVRIYVNGVQETSFSASTNPDQNETFSIGTTSDPIVVGGLYGSGYGISSGSTSEHFGGYIAELVVCEGQSLAPTSFGEFDEDSPTQWKPINVSGLTFGNNGFYLDFEDSGNLGNDANGGTDLTEVNIAATDQSTDTCTNNFATLNPLDVTLLSNVGNTFTEGNLVVTDGSSNYLVANGSIAVTQGKWYFEVKMIESTDTHVASGVMVVDLDLDDKSDGAANGNYGWLYATNGQKRNAGTSSNYGDTYTQNDIIGVALDMDNKAIYFSKNGTFQASGDPTSGASKTNAAYTNLAGTITAQVYDGQGSEAHEFSMNFGSPNHSVSSGNADANGHGNFEYAVPSGYFALCSKNLAEFG